MEDLTKKLLEDYGVDLNVFFDAYKNELLASRIREQEYYEDVILEPWSEESKIKFSNRVYQIFVNNTKGIV